MFFARTSVKPTGLYNQWSCVALSSDYVYYPEVGYPMMGSGRHHVIVHARNIRSAVRKVEKVLRKSERKFTY
jgi:hypothetical protein